MENEVVLRGTLTAREATRCLLSGAPMVLCTVTYEGKVTEAGHERKLKFDVSCKALGDPALSLEKEQLGSELILKGFLAPSSYRSQKLLLHITEYEKGV